MRVDVITLLPELVLGVGRWGVTGRAVERDLLRLVCWNPRDYTADRHATVDDHSYGGGPGMVMKPEPLTRAIAGAREAVADQAPVIYLSPQGRRLDQDAVLRLSREPRVILLAGRYEGIDERVLGTVDDEISIGDYVLSGGELAAMVVIDAVARQLPGVLGSAESVAEESFSAGLLEYPHYTRPAQFAGREVPGVLRGGDHAAIRRWRLRESLRRTLQRRPDLLRGRKFSDEERELLQELGVREGSSDLA